VQSKAKTVAEYLAQLPPDRREALERVRQTILANLDRDYEEGMSYGMIGYYVPHRIYPAGYHCDPRQPLPFAGLASQKNHMSMYMMSSYGDEASLRWLQEQFAKAGKKLDMGKSCIRFKKLDDLPLSVIGEAIRRVPAARYIEHYERQILTMNKKAAAQSATAKRPRPTAKKARRKAVKKATRR
jgi:uncharacterized protein YdhG (YjbR/CyaY superfamily)